MGMYCRKCRYDLRQAASGRCPECGRAFDPLLSETYRENPKNKVELPWRTIVTFSILFGLGFTFERIVNASYMQSCSTPRYSRAVSQLRTARSQIHLYANQHDETYPTLDQLNNHWGVLTNATNVEGLPPSDGDITYGPYLQRPPVNAMTGSSRVAPPGQSTARDGWEYDETTGMVWLVFPTQDEYDEAGARPDEAVVASRP